MSDDGEIFTVGDTPGDVVSSAGQIFGALSGNPLVSLASSVVGGLFGKKSSSKANKQAVAMMREQMAWQERMSNTQYQRGVTDMRAAGLNPMLLMTKGAGAMPAGVSAAPVLDEGAGFRAGSAQGLAMASMQAQLELTKAQTAKTLAEAKTEAMRPEAVSMQTKLNLSQAMNQEAMTTLAKNQGLLVAAQEVNQVLQNEINKSTLPAFKKEELLKLIAERKVSESDAQRAKTDQEFFNSEIGSIMRTVALVLRAVGINTGR